MIVALALLSVASTPAFSQSASEPWRTVRTEHYRVHYPLAAEAFALQSAAELESIHASVEKEVGFAPKETIDVVIEDPYATSNGEALPFLHGPRIEIWATPPSPDSEIGNYRSWGELVLTHEDTHIVHLIRPSRNPLLHLVQSVTGAGPMVLKAPRWVDEGYATVVEGRLTGSGRPFSDFRATWLRHLAQEGRLPTYDELNGNGRFMGGADAYLVGSAFLEWLEARAGEGSLRKLWARMTARKNRTFDEAFRGTFGDTPQVLYGRFLAELTGDAMKIDESRPIDPGTLWLDLQGYVGAPAVSPDGLEVAVVASPAEGKPGRLLVYATTDDKDQIEKLREKAGKKPPRTPPKKDDDPKSADDGKTADGAPADGEEPADDGKTSAKKPKVKDPDDVEDVAPKAPPRTLITSRRASTVVESPRWLPDGSAILFTGLEPDASGRYRTDLYEWNPGDRHDTRITRRQDVRDADPAPDGTWAVATRVVWGATQLVRVSLADGTISDVTPLRADMVVDHARVSPDGTKIAYLRALNGPWELVVRDVASGEDRVLALPAGASISAPAWSPDGTQLYASVGLAGFCELWSIALDGTANPLTRTRGGAFSPTPTPDGTALFYLSTDADGFDVHRIALDAVAAPSAVDLPSSSVVRPEPPSRPLPRVATLPAPKRYGLGRTEWLPLAGGEVAPGQAAAEVGFRAGDMIGRRELLLLGSIGSAAGVSGVRVATQWRVLPMDLEVDGWVASKSGDERGGMMALASGERLWDHGRAGLTVGGFADTALVDGGTRGVGFAELSLARAEANTGWWRVYLRERARGGENAGSAFWAADTTVSLALGRGAGVRGSYTLGAGDAKQPIDQYQVGGQPSGALPGPVQWGSTFDGAFRPGATGPVRDRMELDVGRAPSLFFVRDRVGESLGAHAASAVGVDVSTHVGEQPLVRLPGLSAQAGVACRVEDPDEGWDKSRPCTTLDDWGGWASLTWGF